MAIVKHFRGKMRLASFCCVNLNKYTMPRKLVFNLISTLKITSSVGLLDALGTFCEKNIYNG